jgi:two-component system cell cycle sensor histidine kinase/response regulator CckA
LLQTTEKPRPKTILLIDDDRGVRTAISQALQKRDFELIEAASPEAAAMIWSKQQNEIDLILLDVMLPGLSGPELANEIREQNPNAPIIYMTGIGKEKLSKFNIPQGARVLYKPFAVSELREMIVLALAEIVA